jgi:DNA-binding response OmpR family regulator
MDKILIVEDDKAIRMGLQDDLHRRAGEVASSLDGKDD